MQTKHEENMRGSEENMAEKPVDEKKLRYMEFINRETGWHHHTHAEDTWQFELLKAGDMRAVEEGILRFNSANTGHLSDDPVRNRKYLFVTSVTQACRAAINGGMDSERAYNISDLYIQKMDILETEEEICKLHADMMTFYTKEMAELDRKRVYSRPVVICMDYILLRKLEAARNMLKYSEYSYAEISAILAFSFPEPFLQNF